MKYFTSVIMIKLTREGLWRRQDPGRDVETRLVNVDVYCAIPDKVKLHAIADPPCKLGVLAEPSLRK